MMQVPRDLLEEIRARCDIVDIIGGYLHLIRAGSRFKALCPFHQEKTPSFHVNPQMQAYHCFGCNAGGDVFRFVMEHEGVDFMTAIRLLAHRAGIPVQLDDDGSDGPARGEKDALYRVQEDVAAFYHACLAEEPAAEPARSYLASRDLGGEISEQYRFGFSPPETDVLLAWARGRKIEPDLLVRSGILAESASGGGRFYDRFHGRLMIPINDELGRVIGFTGRVLRAEDSPAKYVNSPETPLFRKSRVLFGLDRARKPMVEARCAVLCEGQLDTIRCQVAGIANAVAAQGTSVTEEHARILARYADEVVLLLDPDEAGRRAALRSAQLLMAAGLGVRVAALPEGRDPDALIREAGAEAVRAIIGSAGSAMAFLVREQERIGELGSEAGRVRAARAAIELASHAGGAVQREHLLREAAERLDVREEALRSDFSRASRRGPLRSAAVETHAAAKDPPEELELIEVALASPGALAEARRYVPPDRLASPRCRAALAALYAGGVEALRQTAGETPDGDLARMVGRLLVSPRLARLPTGEIPPEQLVEELAARIWRRRLEEQRAEVHTRLRAAAKDERPALEAQRAELSMRLSALGRGWPHARAVIEAELDAAEPGSGE